MFTTIMKQERRSQKSPGVTGKILLVDPNPLDLETYTDILQHFGHEVRMCSSYDDADGCPRVSGVCVAGGQPSTR